MKSDPPQALYDTFEKTQEELVKIADAHKYPLIELSGCTASVILNVDNKLYMGHVGDSRIMYVSEKDLENSNWLPTYLSQDHKPNVPEEKARIESKSGEVKRISKDSPYRVYNKGQLQPGLAITRAMGDISAHLCGVIHEPEIFGIDCVREQGGFIVVASDGAWEFLSPDSIAKCLQKHKVNSAEYIANKAFNRWVNQGIDNSDDITALVYYIK